MHTSLLPLLVCPDCHTRFTQRPSGVDVVTDGSLTCESGHQFAVVEGVPRFVRHALDADQQRTRESFGHEWTVRYPQHGHTPAERQAERDIFLEYTRSLPSEYRGKLVLDAGCGNGRYAKLANDWGARVVCVDISTAVEIAQSNVGTRPDVAVVQADLFKLPFKPGLFVRTRSACIHAGREGRSRDQPLVKPGEFSRSSCTRRATGAPREPVAARGRRRRRTHDVNFVSC
jgi:SAM-dependent methyltransferase